MSQSAELATVLAKVSPGADAAQVARALVRHARALHRLYEAECNGVLSLKMQSRVVVHEKHVERICAALKIRVTFNGDPRGFPVKLHLKGGPSNTWAGDEYGIG